MTITNSNYDNAYRKRQYNYSKDKLYEKIEKAYNDLQEVLNDPRRTKKEIK